MFGNIGEAGARLLQRGHNTTGVPFRLARVLGILKYSQWINREELFERERETEPNFDRNDYVLACKVINHKKSCPSARRRPHRVLSRTQAASIVSFAVFNVAWVSRASLGFAPG
jgi:hypothetical protein